MKNKLFVAVALMASLLWIAVPVIAETKVFNVEANIPTATGISFSAFSVNPADNAFTSLGGSTNLDFGTLTLDPVNNIFVPPSPGKFFAIDVVATGGAGSPGGITLSYSDTLNPNIDPAHGLGAKASTTLVKVIFIGPDPEDTSETGITFDGGPKKLLNDLAAGAAIPATETAGGWLRVYVGLNTGDVSDPAGAEVFTTADAHGLYSGDLTISATAT